MEGASVIAEMEIVTVAEGTVVVPPLLIVTSAVLCSVMVVREVGKVTVLVISSIPSRVLQKGSASAIHS